MNVTFTQSFVIRQHWNGPSVNFVYMSANRGSISELLLGNTKNVLLCRNEQAHIYQSQGIITRIGYYLNKWFNSSTWTEVNVAIETGTTTLKRLVLVKNADIKKSSEIKGVFLDAIQPLQQTNRVEYNRLANLWA